MAVRDQLRGFAQGALVALAQRLRVPLTEHAPPTQYGGYRPVSTSGVAKGLTPSKIASYLANADDGQPGDLWELLEEIEDRDLHLVGVLGTRKRAVANLAWDVLPPERDGRAKARRIAEFCKQRVEEIDNLEDGLLDLLDGVSKGVGFVELDWYLEDRIAGVRSMTYRPQRWFVPDEGDPTTWRLLDQQDPTRGVELEPWRFLVHVSKAKSGFPIQAGLGRVLVWWYLFKNYAVKDWVSYGELFGAPFRVGKYPMGAKPSDITALHTALQKLGVDASAVIPSDMDLEIVTDSRGTAGVDVYERLVTLCEKGMSKAVLGQTLTTEEGSSGSYALGQVHNDVRQDLVESDARQLARTLRRGLLQPLVLHNFGPDAPVPSWVFDTEPPADEKAVAEAQETRARVFVEARKLGVPIAMSQVRDELDLYEPAAGEELLPEQQAGPDPTTTTQGPEPVAATSRHPWVPGWVALAGGTSPALPPWLAQAEGELQRILEQGGHRDAWQPFMERLRTELDRVTDFGQVPGKLVELLDEMDLEVLGPQLADTILTGELLAELQAEVGDQVVEGLPKVPPREAVDWWQSKGVVTPARFAQLDEAARAKAFTISKWTCASALGEAHQLFEDVLRDGGTLADFEDGLDALYAKTGYAPMKPWQLDNAFRTNWATALSVGRDRQQRRPETLRRRPFWRYNNPDDAASRPAHAAMNGRVYRYDNPIWDVWTAPNGYGCRCWRSAHTAGEVESAGWRVYDAMPTDPGTGRPMLPDDGFRRDPSREPHEFDWTRFPADWREALGVAA